MGRDRSETRSKRATARRLPITSDEGPGCLSRCLEHDVGRERLHGRSLCRCRERRGQRKSKRRRKQRAKHTKGRGKACCPSGSARVAEDRAGERMRRRCSDMKSQRAARCTRRRLGSSPVRLRAHEGLVLQMSLNMRLDGALPREGAVATFHQTVVALGDLDAVLHVTGYALVQALDNLLRQ